MMTVDIYFQKAYELDQLPNEKGKVKPKYTKDIKSILSANHVYLFNGCLLYTSIQFFHNIQQSRHSYFVRDVFLQVELFLQFFIADQFGDSTF